MTYSIEALKIGRQYRSAKKKPGFKGLLSLLFHPEIQLKQAISDISFQVKEGEFVGLIGANGAGKTTLLKVLSGLIPPTHGTATVLGENPFERSLAFRKNIALVMGQKAQLWWDLPANEAFDLLRAIYQTDKAIHKKRLNELTQLLGVTELLQTQIRRLSLGERMKMEIIGAILHRPKLLFLDEPTIGLDLLASHRLRAFLKEHNKTEGTTIVLTSHNMDDISELCERIFVLKEGKLIFDGAPSTLIAKNECQLRVQFSTVIPTQAALAAVQGMVLGIDVDPKHEETLLLSIDRRQLAGVIQKLMTTFSVLDLSIEEASLDRAITKIYRGDTDQ
jgi:ABC-2 type transport system ATP-binding protein